MPQLPTTMRSADAKFCGNYDSQKFMEVSNSFSDVTNNGKNLIVHFSVASHCVETKDHYYKTIFAVIELP